MGITERGIRLFRGDQVICLRDKQQYAARARTVDAVGRIIQLNFLCNGIALLVRLTGFAAFLLSLVDDRLIGISLPVEILCEELQLLRLRKFLLQRFHVGQTVLCFHITDCLSPKDSRAFIRRIACLQNLCVLQKGLRQICRLYGFVSLAQIHAKIALQVLLHLRQAPLLPLIGGIDEQQMVPLIQRPVVLRKHRINCQIHGTVGLHGNGISPCALHHRQDQ